MPVYEDGAQIGRSHNSEPGALSEPSYTDFLGIGGESLST